MLLFTLLSSCGSGSTPSTDAGAHPRSDAAVTRDGQRDVSSAKDVSCQQEAGVIKLRCGSGAPEGGLSGYCLPTGSPCMTSAFPCCADGGVTFETTYNCPTSGVCP
jgi:hypothetical protein